MSLKEAIVAVSFILQVIDCESGNLLCNKQYLTNHISSYDPEQYGMANCRCMSNCIRKCCAFDYSFSAGECYRNNETYNFTLRVEIYDSSQFVGVETSEEKFSLGFVTGCEAKFLRPERAPAEKFYIQRDGKVWVPSQRRVVDQNDYCVDYTHQNGFVVILCVSSFQWWAERIDCVGKA